MTARNNIDFIGALNLLAAIRESGLLTEQQLRQIEARVRAQMGADYIKAIPHNPPSAPPGKFAP